MAYKNNAMRMLEARGVSYETYTFPPEIHSAEGVAQVMGFPANQVYKTLVVIRKQGKPLLVMVAGHRELDLKRLAKAVGEKKLRMYLQGGRIADRAGGRRHLGPGAPQSGLRCVH